MALVRLHRAPAAPATPAYEDDLGRALRLAQEAWCWQGEVEDLLVAIRDGGDLAELSRAGGPIISRYGAMRVEARAIGHPALHADVVAMDKVFANHAMVLHCALDLLAVELALGAPARRASPAGWRRRAGHAARGADRAAQASGRRRMSARWDRAAAAVAVVLGVLLVVGASARRGLDGGVAAPALPTWPLLFVAGVGFVVALALGLAILGPVMRVRAGQSGWACCAPPADAVAQPADPRRDHRAVHDRRARRAAARSSARRRPRSTRSSPASRASAAPTTRPGSPRSPPGSARASSASRRWRWCARAGGAAGPSSSRASPSPRARATRPPPRPSPPIRAPPCWPRTPAWRRALASVGLARRPSDAPREYLAASRPGSAADAGR